MSGRQVSAEKILKGLLKEKVIGGLDIGNYYPELKGHLLISVTEKRTKEEIERLVALLQQYPSP